MRNLATIAGAAAFVAVLGVGGTAWADTIEPTSYDMPNGQGGSFTYYDETYSGAGDPTTALSPLSGGLGDLTDDVIAAGNWIVEETVANGPYVGWRNVDPTIDFDFDGDYLFDTVTLEVDDSNGTGGVFPPTTVKITVGANTQQVFAITDPGTSTPITLPLDVGGEFGDSVSVEVISKANGLWVMVSEIDFAGSPQISELDTCDLGSGNEGADVNWISVSSDGETISVLVKFCGELDPRVKARVHFDYTDQAVADGNNDPDTDTIVDCQTSSDDGMKLGPRGKETGPGVISPSGDTILFEVNYDELTKNSVVLGGGDNVLIWVDTQFKGIIDRAPNTQEPCSKPQGLGEVIDHTLASL